MDAVKDWKIIYKLALNFAKHFAMHHMDRDWDRFI